MPVSRAKLKHGLWHVKTFYFGLKPRGIATQPNRFTNDAGQAVSLGNLLAALACKLNLKTYLYGHKMFSDGARHCAVE